MFMVIGALLVGALLTGALLATASLKPPRDQHEHYPERDYSKYPGDKKSPNAPLLIAIADEIQRARKDTNAKDADKRYRESLTICGIYTYTVITGFILGATLYQSSIAKDTERRQLQAYLGPFGDFEIKCPSCEDRRIPPSDTIIPNNYVSYRIRNYGSTPARDVNICFNLWALGKMKRSKEDAIIISGVAMLSAEDIQPCGRPKSLRRKSEISDPSPKSRMLSIRREPGFLSAESNMTTFGEIRIQLIYVEKSCLPGQAKL